MPEPNDISTLKKWLIAIRPFALPASTMPVIFGTVLAVVIGGASLNMPLFIMGFFAMIILHSGANMLNDVMDYKMNIDKVPTPVSGAVVRGMLSLKQVLSGAIILLIVGTLMGLYLAWIIGPVLLVVGLIGVMIGVFYTAGPLALKYHALGDLAVFLDFGVLGALGAWLVQTRTFSWLPVLWTVPIGMLVIGILHANNWRDKGSDTETGIFTVASLLGDRKSLFIMPCLFSDLLSCY